MIRGLLERIGILKPTAPPVPPVDLALRGRAVDWLRARGKVLGVDFAEDTALELANDLSCEDEKTRLMAEARERWEDGFIVIDNDGCYERGDRDCPGWDGVSDRCRCGAQRVRWYRWAMHSFEEPDVTAEIVPSP